MKQTITTLEQTQQLAQDIAKKLRVGDVICLTGDLGAGKTAFTRYLINSLSDQEMEVLSPTFNLVIPYELNDFTIWHFDLYRLQDENEILELGIYDAFDQGVSVIEWPQIISGILPANRLLIQISSQGEERQFDIHAFGDWEKRL